MQLEQDNRRARADGIIASLSPNETQRYEDAASKLRLHLATIYGDRLNALVVDNLLVEAVLDLDVFDAVHGQPPLTDTAWRNLAQKLADSDEWVSRNLEFSDAQTKAEIREQTLSSLPGARRMAMQRSGELDTYVDNAVRKEMDARCAQRTV